ncbi:MAG TPA: outer membrane beta-barrel protein [Puia sp.]|nr:outer membrane beta-barrel protein [Puia sp.]
MRVPLTPLVLIAFMQSSNAQVKTPPTQSAGAGLKPEFDFSHIGQFHAHTWDISPDVRAALSQTNASENGQAIDKQTVVRAGMGAYYFFSNHWAVGLGFDLNSSHTTDEGASTGSSTVTKWSLNPGLEYGWDLTPKVGMYLRGSFGFGDYNSSTSNATSSYSNKESTFSYGGQIGFPIRLGDRTPVSFTPFVSYWNTKYSLTGETEKDNIFGVGVRLDSYFGCSDFACDSHNGYRLSRAAFLPGQNFINYGDDGRLRFGSENTTYSGGSITGTKLNVVDDCFDVCYGHFFFPGIAFGAEINVRGTSDSYQGIDEKNTTSSWRIGPIVEYHPFEGNGINNFAIKGGIGFGADKSTSTYSGSSGSGSSSVTQNYFGYNAGIAYVDYFAPSLAIVPEVGYRGSTLKYNSGSTKESYNGFFLGWGVRYSF